MALSRNDLERIRQRTGIKEAAAPTKLKQREVYDHVCPCCNELIHEKGAYPKMDGKEFARDDDGDIIEIHGACGGEFKYFRTPEEKARRAEQMAEMDRYFGLGKSASVEVSGKPVIPTRHTEKSAGLFDCPKCKFRMGNKYWTPDGQEHSIRGPAGCTSCGYLVPYSNAPEGAYIKLLSITDLTHADAATVSEKTKQLNQLPEKGHGIKEVGSLSELVEGTKDRGRAELRKEAAVTEAPRTGPAAIAAALRGLDLKALREKAMHDIKSGKKTVRPNAIAILNAVEGLERNNLTPADLLITRVPVMPTKFRPFGLQGETLTMGDANELYRDLLQMRQSHNRLVAEIGEEQAGDSILGVYDTVRAVYGQGEPPNPKTAGRGVKGILHRITGQGPKFSWLNAKMIAKPQDNVGRSVITVNPDLGIDEVGIPVSMAWDMFKTQIQGVLARQGMSGMDALRHIKDQTPEARRVLDQLVHPETGQPVVYSRAPAWHQFNTVAGWAKLHDGNDVQVNNYVTTGQNADFDGDEAIGITFVALPASSFSALALQFNLTKLPKESTLWAMFKKLSIPVLDPKEHTVAVVDLENFPHGEFDCHVDGANGPIDFFHAIPGTKVIAYDEKTGRPVWANVSFYSKHAQRKVEIVELSTGRQIYTDDDPRAVYGVDPADPEQKLQRFTPTAAENAGVLVPFIKDAAHELFSVEGESSVRVTDVEDCSFKVLPLDWNLGWALGALCGDGWWDKRDHDFYLTRAAYQGGRRCINIADLAGANASRLEEFLSASFNGGKPVFHYELKSTKEQDPSRYGDSVKHTFCFKYSELFAVSLERWLGGEKTENSTGSASKHLPGFAFHAPRNFRLGLLAGLVDTDGSCSVSQAKGKAQLLCAMTSTSLRLCREVVLLCRTLGIEATVTFSKTTTRDNESWIVNMSTADCKRLNVFANLASDGKRRNFVETEVEFDNSSVVFDKVALPNHIGELVRSNLMCKRVPDRDDESEETVKLKQAQNIYSQWVQACANNLVGRATLERVIGHLGDQVEAANLVRFTAIRDLERDSNIASPERVALWRSAILATAPKNGDQALYKEGYSIYARLNAPLRTGKAGHKVRAGVAAWLKSKETPKGCLADPIFQSWVKFHRDNHMVAWAKVVGVQRTGIREDGYDLTVPGYETFMSADGVILSNTVNVHAYVTPEAIEDAKEKLFPSKMLFSGRDFRKIVNPVKHEQIIGLFSPQVGQPSGKIHVFATEDHFLKAYDRGDVDPNDEVEIGGKPM